MTVHKMIQHPEVLHEVCNRNKTVSMMSFGMFIFDNLTVIWSTHSLQPLMLIFRVMLNLDMLNSVTGTA
jgi:hypothetical protein